MLINFKQLCFLTNFSNFEVVFLIQLSLLKFTIYTLFKVVNMWKRGRNFHNEFFFFQNLVFFWCPSSCCFLICEVKSDSLSRDPFHEKINIAEKGYGFLELSGIFLEWLHLAGHLFVGFEEFLNLTWSEFSSRNIKSMLAASSLTRSWSPERSWRVWAWPWFCNPEISIM